MADTRTTSRCRALLFVGARRRGRVAHVARWCRGDGCKAPRAAHGRHLGPAESRPHSIRERGGPASSAIDARRTLAHRLMLMSRSSLLPFFLQIGW